MKSFATGLLLAATVSATTCFTDGCNCSGEYKECYSYTQLQSFTPVCCGSSPTTAPVTDSLSSTVTTKHTSNTVNDDGSFQGNTKNARYSWSVDANGKPVIVWENNKGSKVAINQRTSLYDCKSCVGLNQRTRLEKSPIMHWVNKDERVHFVEVDANGEESLTPMEDLTKSSADDWFNTAPTATLRQKWKYADCTSYCNANGAYPPTGCEDKMNTFSPHFFPCAPLATTSLLSQQKKEFMAEQKSSLTQDCCTERFAVNSSSWSVPESQAYCKNYGTYHNGYTSDHGTVCAKKYEDWESK